MPFASSTVFLELPNDDMNKGLDVGNCPVHLANHKDQAATLPSTLYMYGPP